MKDLIIFAGAPGSGKTTIGRLLKERLGDATTPMIDFGDLRIWHLVRDWSNQSEMEEEMAFDNLVYVLKNYIKHGYENTIVNDFKDNKISRLAEVFKENNILIITLVVNDQEELTRRVRGESTVGERDSGFRNVELAQEYQNDHLVREILPNEYRIDNTHNKPEETVDRILEIINGK